MVRNIGVSVVGAWTTVLLGVASVAQVASASVLEVDGGVLQVWTLNGNVPDLGLKVCGPLDKYEAQIIMGTPGDDVLRPEPKNGNGPQIILGLGGDDRLEGGNHEDCLVGGEGDDTLLGGNGQDILDGGPGQDWLDGGEAPDVIRTGSDVGDTCFTDGNPDEILGTCLVQTTPELYAESSDGSQNSDSQHSAALSTQSPESPDSSVSEETTQESYTADDSQGLPLTDAGDQASESTTTSIE